SPFSGHHASPPACPTRRSSDLGVRDGFFDDEALGGDAALPVVLYARLDADLHGAAEVGIFEHDEGIGAAELEHGRLEVLAGGGRSEEHTSELQSRENLVCRLLL